jgi:predicted RNase H-like HicB family nuclease
MKAVKRYFTVIIEKDEETNMYVGEVPGLHGCHTHGKTIDELMKNMQEIIELCLEVEKEEAQNLPKFVGVQQIEVPA